MKYTIGLVLSLVSFSQLYAQQWINVPIRPNEWKTTHGTIQVVPYMGREALYLSEGVAYLPKSNFSQGTIEVDIAPTFPGFGGLVFHLDSLLNYEEVYIRNSKSGNLDACQYSPAFNGESSWQLYPEYQSTVHYSTNEWIHLRLTIKDKKAICSIKGKDTGTLYIDSLRIANEKGAIGLWSLSGAYFSNLRYTPLPLDSIAPKTSSFNDSSVIKNWGVSTAYPFDEKDKQVRLIFPTAFQKITSEPDGLVNINRFIRKKTFGRFRYNSAEYVWLEYHWNSNGKIQPFSFDFSNRCFVFMNGHQLFAGNNSFQLKGPLDRGSFDKKTRSHVLYLATRKGKNQLLIAVQGIANGWGFLGRFSDCSL
jgi:hypothetical protein